jgi:hypothetical protein
MATERPDGTNGGSAAARCRTAPAHWITGQGLVRRLASVWPILLSALLLSWPALWNGYPIVFADSGTYLSQAVHHYLGWDRPVFYSLAILPLHLTLSPWPIVWGQTLVAAWVLKVAGRALGGGTSPRRTAWRIVPLAAFLAVASWLPWMASEIMPDLFTPLLVIALSLLIFAADDLIPVVGDNDPSRPPRHGEAWPHTHQDSLSQETNFPLTVMAGRGYRPGT